MPGAIASEHERPAAGRGGATEAGGAPAGRLAGTAAARPRGEGNRLLWIVAGAFAVLLIAWTTFIIIARRHPVTPVSISAPGRGSR